jgi:hypothetical protein
VTLSDIVNLGKKNVCWNQLKNKKIRGKVDIPKMADLAAFGIKAVEYKIFKI